MKKINDVSITIATVNGSGSQSANLILMRAIFRMGIPVAGKNLFPSNIAGLPTWFSIRVNDQGHTTLRTPSDVVVAMNQQTADEDIGSVQPGGIFFHNSGLKFTRALIPGAVAVPVDFSKIASTVSDSIKLKKLLANMVYVGVLAELLAIPDEVMQETIEHQFGDKKNVIDLNIAAVKAGRDHCKAEIKIDFPYKLEKRETTKGKLLIDGNSAGGLGAVYAGCTMMSWYPITPSSSLAESFEKYCHQLRKSPEGKNLYSIIQAEDELSAITMVAGAGWAGARAMTTTSGPGISLMAECAGMMHFAEIPGVLWNVQRAGPSTGLPTRTLQGDVLSCAQLSHGDTRHPLLFPATPKECFDFATTAFDLAEELQTLVFVMSDLDLGMNYWISDEFKADTQPYKRGKVLDEKTLEKFEVFKRYADVDGDGIPYRTLPGTEHDRAGYFTRGTGHDESAKYTESPDTFKKLLDRLAKKWRTAKTMVPAPVIDQKKTDLGLIAFGSTDSAIPEVRAELKAKGVETSYMRLRAFPFNDDVEKYLASHKKITVLEQNHDGQMRRLLSQEYPQHAAKLTSSLLYDGWPVRSKPLVEGVLNGTH